jgi:hypothetical protein
VEKPTIFHVTILLKLSQSGRELTGRRIRVMSNMSDSDLSDAPRSASVPSDRELEQALRKEVRDALKPGNDDPFITVSSMRKAAEEALGLEAGFYKRNEKWKEGSKRIVHEAFVRCEMGDCDSSCVAASDYVLR